MASNLTVAELASRLRDHIIGALHVGQLQAADRLPSIREVAESLRVDPRKVARAYRVLETEGLVEVRGRSGVYAAPQARLEGGILEETAEWVAGVLYDGWKRRIPVSAVPKLLQECSASAPLRCAFVDSCEDAIEAFSYELREEFGVEVTPVWLHELWPPASNGRDIDDYPASLTQADFVATTIFNATAVRSVMQRLGKPIEVVTVHPQSAAALIAHLNQGPLTVVCADPTFGDRIRLQYHGQIGEDSRLRVVLAEDRDAVAALDREEPVLLTRAARRRLGDVDFNLVTPHSPTLSPTSAQELIRLIVRINSRGVGARTAP